MEIILILILASLLFSGIVVFWSNRLKTRNKLDELILKSTKLHEKNDEFLRQHAILTRKISESLQDAQALREEKNKLQQQLDSLSKYQMIVDAEAAAQKIIRKAKEDLFKSQQYSLKIKKETDDAVKEKIDKINLAVSQKVEEVKRTIKAKLEETDRIAKAKIDTANVAAARKKEQAEFLILSANENAEKIIAAAKQKAEEIAGDAYLSLNKMKELNATKQALKNIIEGYGDEYIIPTYSLLDELADEVGYTEAGQELKAARSATRLMVKEGKAATCEYVEAKRKETAIRFVVDAFNGKVDSILSRGRADNHGKLAQEIKDAYSLVNHNGSAFRNAKITDEYLAARLEELKWAATAHALKEKEREEQRQIREQIREEEKARKEFERALKEAEKEEDAIKKAMEKIQQKVAEATELQRAEYEAKLRDLEARLQTAEEKSQRALSMAQQTKTGHVYVISNIGSFGENVFKIGMTRRLEPTDRVRELGDASVPFAFDIHAMIFSEDAPDLEKKLHRHFLKMQLNKVNPRKEFFRVSLSDIKKELDELGVETNWTMTAAAFEYRESLKIEQQMQQNREAEQQWAAHQLAIEDQLAIEETEEELEELI